MFKELKMRVRLDINGLDCPHCALKLEGMIKEHPEVKDASINFASKLLLVDTHQDVDEDEFAEKMQKIANDFEDGIEVSVRD